MTEKLSAPVADDRFAKLRHWARTRVPALALMALVALAYYSAMRAEFVWNDKAHVARAAPMRSVDGLKQTWLQIESFPRYQPLVHSSFWLEYQLWETLPYGYHVTNIFIHAVCVVVLWKILLLLKVPGAWFAAAIFAVHPVNVESVAWISQRENVLCGLFYLSAIWAYLDGAYLDWSLSEENPRGRWWVYALSLLLFVCALLCNSVACTLPIALLVILWWKRGRIARADLVRLSPFFAMGLAMWLSTVLMEKHVVGAMGSVWNISPLERTLVAGRAVWFYAWKLVWPYPLVFIYPLWQIDASQAWQYALPLGVAVLLLFLWIARARIGRGAFTAIALFLLALLPALGLFNANPMLSSFVSDHFQYLAGIALITLLVSAAWTPAAGNRAARVIRVAAGLGLVAVLMVLTNERCRVFRDSESLCLDTIAKNPQAWVAHTNLGVVKRSRGDTEGAKHSLETALELRPESVNAHNYMGVLLMASGRLVDATGHFQEAVRIEPDFIRARLNLCRALATSGKFQEAISHFLHALRLDSRVAHMHGHIAMALLDSADHQSAVEFFDEAISVKQDWALMLNAMAWILATSHDSERHDPRRALELAGRATELTNHTDASILDTLAAAQARAGDFDEACETQGRALAIIERQRNARLAAEFRDRLRLFEEGKAYMEPKKPDSGKRREGPR